MATMKLGSKPDVFHLDGLIWTCMAELESDIVVEVGEMSFHLHKFPLLSRSALLQKLISSAASAGVCTLQLHEIPGGAKAFELVAKFCYDVKIELNARNVVYVRCAAEYLQMTEELCDGNLVVQAESFLNDVLSCNWKDSIKVLEKCEGLPFAEELHIVSRCINSLAAKACADPEVYGWPPSLTKGSAGDQVLWNGIGAMADQSDWWYRDVSFLGLSLFKRLIQAVEAKGMRPENIAGALMFYAGRFLPGLNRNVSMQRDGTCITPRGSSLPTPPENDQKVFLEEIVELLPVKKDVTSAKFLLSMLRTAMILHASPSCRENLEKRIAAQLGDAALEDLLIPNLGYSVETIYDVDCVQRILDHFVAADQATSCLVSPSMLDNGQLAEVAADANLKLTKFQTLAAAVPEYSRPLDDGIYRAIDIYLKAHPWLTESEREQLCRLMNCQKLSLEACTHAAQNERLPLRVVVQVLFFEQLRLRTSISGWFLLSDDHNDLQPPTLKSHSRTCSQELDNKKDNSTPPDVDEMKLRVSELERECLNMKKEVLKRTATTGGKPKKPWKIFTKKSGVGAHMHTALSSST